MNLLDQVIKLRCVNVSKHGQVFHISLTALSSCLKIREWFYDARHLRKCLGEEKLGKKSDDDYKKNYHAASANQISTIKNCYNLKNQISVKELMKKLEQGGQNIGQTFIVSGKVFGIVDTKPENIVYIVDNKQGKVLPMNKPPKHQEYRFVINLVLTIADSKAGKDNEHVNVYVTSSSEDSSHTFDNWHIIPRISEKKKWLAVSQA